MNLEFRNVKTVVVNKVSSYKLDLAWYSVGEKTPDSQASSPMKVEVSQGTGLTPQRLGAGA